MGRPFGELSGIASQSIAGRYIANSIVSVYNVLDFGALGDGITNDTPACQRALKAASSDGGGVVFFPPGVYNLVSPILLISNCSLLGSGRYISVLKSDTAINLLQADSLTELYQIMITNLGFTGVRNNSTSVGISFRPLGLAAVEAYHDIHIYDCHFVDISLGINFVNQNTTGNADDWQISDVTIHNCTARRVRAGLLNLNVRRATVSNCRVVDSYYDGIDVLNGEFITISNLVASQCNEYGVIIRDRVGNGFARPTRNIVVTNSIFDRCAGGVIVVTEAGGGGVMDVEVTGCSHRAATVNGFTTSLVTNVTFADCTARNATNRGFYIIGGEDITLNNCRAYNAGVAGIVTVANPINFRPLNCQVDGNDFAA